MTAYYNEIDPFAAQWLRNLIAKNLIAPGDVDERSILDVAPDDLRGYTQCHFFAGIGVWSHALRRAGWSDDRPVWTGSCPCQPFSSAGVGAGFADERHLWPAFHWLIAQSRPDTVLGEQVGGKPGDGWFDLVRTDLEASGFACGISEICAAGVGAPHNRPRNFWVAHAAGERRDWQYTLLQRGQPPKGRVEVAGRRAGSRAWAAGEWAAGADGTRRWIEPGTEPLAHGVTNRVGLLRAYGNAINAEAGAAFVSAFMEAASA